LVGTQLAILPLRAAAALALLTTAVCFVVITIGEWMGARHEQHL